MDARMIAHDMRTPLNAIKFALSAAVQAKEPEQIKRAISIANRNAEALSAIIESMLETGTSEGRLKLAEWRPFDLITSAIDQIVPFAEQKMLRVEAGEAVALPPLCVDGIRIIRVLVNLLSNAVSFSPQDGCICVDAHRRVNDGHTGIVFSVADEGPGVAPHDYESIFQTGVSLGRTSTGLGLATCKEIVEAHGGRIWIDTTTAKGATFSFTIPVTILPAE